MQGAPTPTPPATTGTDDKTASGPPQYTQLPQGPQSATVTSSANIPAMPVPEQVTSLGDPKKQAFTFAAAETILSVNSTRVQLPIGLNPSKYSAAPFTAKSTPPSGNTCVVATLGLPTASLTFHIEAECIGQYPGIPQPVPVWSTSDGIQGALLSSVIEPMPPVMDATQSKSIFHVSCRYIYALSRPPQPNEKIPIGVLPMSNMTPQQTALAIASLYYDPNQQVLGAPVAPTPPANNNWAINPASGTAAAATKNTNW
jgi:hypothetical protein